MSMAKQSTECPVDSVFERVSYIGVIYYYVHNIVICHWFIHEDSCCLYVARHFSAYFIKAVVGLCCITVVPRW